MFDVKVSTGKIKVEDHNMPGIGYNAITAKGPSGSAKYGVSTNGVDAKTKLSAGKVKGELGYVKAAFNPNLNTSASIGQNGVDLRLAGTGASFSSKGAKIHTAFGSLGIRFPWKK